MLEALDEINLKPSSRACSDGRDFISVGFFRTCVFFSNSLNKKRTNGRSKICGKKIGHCACLRVNNFSLFW